MQTTETKPQTESDKFLIKQAMNLYLRTGNGFIMHMNNGTTLCRKCVAKDGVRIFGSLSNWSREDKDAACFADLYTKETAGAKRCSLCNEAFSLHHSPPPLSLAVSRMSRGRKSYSFHLYNRNLNISTIIPS